MLSNYVCKVHKQRSGNTHINKNQKVDMYMHVIHMCPFQKDPIL